MPYALNGYRTTYKNAIGSTPYNLVFGSEVVHPIEMQRESLRVVLESEVPEAEWVKARYEQLALLDEKRLKALYHLQLYQKRVERAFNKRVRPKTFQKGDLVLKQCKQVIPDPRGKFRPNWEGPYLVKQVYGKGAVKLTDMDGNEFSEPINIDRLKKYYV